MQDNKSTNIPQLVDINYIVKISGFTKAHIYNEIKAGKLAEPIKFGRASRWTEKNVMDWLNIYMKQEG